jgi:uncharacterized protein YaaN involved in tellurite resistance
MRGARAETADRVLAALDETARILAGARATSDRLLRELEELRENLRQLRQASHDGAGHDGGGTYR